MSATRRVLVTGAASGIGRALVGALARRGHRVLATDLSLDALALASSQDGWPAHVRSDLLDVTSASSWDASFVRAIETLGSVEVLFNVAGVLSPAYTTDVAPADLDRMLDVNVKGVVLGTRAAARHMIERALRGHIVNVGSLASLSPVPGLSVYCATKWAVRGFSLSAAIELEPHGIAVSLVCPDAVNTPMLEVQRDREEAALTFSGSRELTADDVAELLAGRVLDERPLELAIPEHRGLLARVAGTLPRTSQRLYPFLKSKGRAKQQRG